MNTGSVKKLSLLQRSKKFRDKSGKETNVEKATEIFFEIGVIYRTRSPEKVSIIKSADYFF